MELLGDLREWAPGDTAAGRKIEELARFNAKSKAAVAEIKKIPREAAAAENAAALFGQDAGEIKKQLQAAYSKYQYGLTEKKRIAFLRVLAALIGMAIAWTFRINCLEMLSGLLPAASVETLAAPAARIGGTLLTGLAEYKNTSLYNIYNSWFYGCLWYCV